MIIKPSKLIFLDMDHVLTNTDLDNSSFKSFDPSKYHLSKINLKFLDMILENTDAKIVIASNWRKFSPPNTKWLYNGKYYESILEPFKKMYNQYIFDMLPNDWFDLVNGKYVILEDDLREEYQLNPIFAKHLILTDYHVGLTEKDAINAINMLKS